MRFYASADSGVRLARADYSRSANPHAVIDTTQAPESLHHDADGGFNNPWPTAPSRDHIRFLKWWRARGTTRPRQVDPRRSSFTRAEPSFVSPRAAPDALTITWVGHATFLIQIGGLNVLTDPMWSNRASFIPVLGPRRWVPPGIAFDRLPPIDVVLQSHNHYDHLDARTVRRIIAAHPGARWLVPLGVGAFLRSRGARTIVERDWWDAALVGDVRFTCVPAQHFSARSATDRWRTLWCGWTMRSVIPAEHGGPAPRSRGVYFAGDTAWFPGFDDIGEKCGPFNAILMPIGGYLPASYMRYLHMAPAEAVRAYRTLTDPSLRDGPSHVTPAQSQSGVHGNGRSPQPEQVVDPAFYGRKRSASTFIPMHWGTFKLTDEAMDEPPRALRRAWESASLDDNRLKILSHGETVAIRD